MAIKDLIKACDKIVNDKRFEAMSTFAVRERWREMTREAESELKALQLEIKLLKERKPAQLSFDGEIIDPELAKKVRELEYEVTTIPKDTTVVVVNVIDTDLNPEDLEVFRNYLMRICNKHEMDEVAVVVISGRSPIRSFSDETLRRAGLERVKDSW
jgi:hypothetical protein